MKLFRHLVSGRGLEKQAVKVKVKEVKDLIV